MDRLPVNEGTSNLVRLMLTETERSKPVSEIFEREKQQDLEMD